MALFFWQRKENFLSATETQQVVAAIKAAEKRTSGEIRVFIESRCRYVKAIDRAQEIFFQLEMDETEQRNATLLYIATKDKQLAVFGDEGIYKKTGTAFWNNEVTAMLNAFKSQKFAEGIVGCVTDIGEALHRHFPYEADDKNELPDDIIFGK
ncbi:MAG: TPM domain-containing protein [Flavihumibacter sp.]|nr:TPM domain-containing protein [Flavihumibacter sp.]